MVHTQQNHMRSCCHGVQLSDTSSSIMTNFYHHNWLPLYPYPNIRTNVHYTSLTSLHTSQTVCSSYLRLYTTVCSSYLHLYTHHRRSVHHTYVSTHITDRLFIILNPKGLVRSHCMRHVLLALHKQEEERK